MKHAISRRDFLGKTLKGGALAAAGGCGVLLQGCDSKKDYDLVITGGHLVDGRGGPAYPADLGIVGRTIRRIGAIEAKRGRSVIEASGRVVAPGFIDLHDHSDTGLLVNPRAESHVRQGITTLISGNCGSTPFPVAEAIRDEMHANLFEEFGLELDWTDMEGFLSRLEKIGLAVNYATLVGHGTIRGAAMGFNDRDPSPEETAAMKRMVEDHMRRGAFGISTGLEYTPGSFARIEELTELCRVAAAFDGVHATHMRDEGDRLLESLEEVIEVSRRSGVSLQISHFKTAYPANWNKIDDALAAIEAAEKDGVALYCDRYPYTAGATGLSFNFPLWARQGTTDEFLARLRDPSLEASITAHLAEREKNLGSWDQVLISSVVSEKNKWVEGLSVLEAASKSERSPYALMRDLIIEERNRVGMILFMMTEENLARILAHPLVGVGCDASVRAPYGPLAQGKPHPRNYGTFPRVLGHYVREKKIVPLEEMIMKMTSRPAGKFGLGRRGVLESGSIADIVVFDPDRVVDRATWTDPHVYPEGIDDVIVGGEAVIAGGEHTGRLPGSVLRKSADG